MADDTLSCGHPVGCWNKETDTCGWCVDIDSMEFYETQWRELADRDGKETCPNSFVAQTAARMLAGFAGNTSLNPGVTDEQLVATSIHKAELLHKALLKREKEKNNG